MQDLEESKTGSSYKVHFIFVMVHMSDKCSDNIRIVKRPGDSVTTIIHSTVVKQTKVEQRDRRLAIEVA